MSDTIQESLRMWVRGEWVAMTDQELVTEAADEIDRLSQTVRDLEQRLAERDKELAEKDKRIEELESRDIGEDCQEWDRANGIYHITTDQINAAWDYRNADPGGYVEAALACFGIVPCEECDGTKILKDDEGNDVGYLVNPSKPYPCDCPNNGWVMEER